MFKRAYTTAMPDQPAAVVNCLRVRQHQQWISLRVERSCNRSDITKGDQVCDNNATTCFVSFLRMLTAGALTCLLWTQPAPVMHYKLCFLSLSPDMSSTAVSRSFNIKFHCSVFIISFPNNILLPSHVFNYKNSLGLCWISQIPISCLTEFLSAVERGYSKYNNPYHSHVHAADVTQTLHCLLLRSGLVVRVYFTWSPTRGSLAKCTYIVYIVLLSFENI